jgi:hypothetical protein
VGNRYRPSTERLACMHVFQLSHFWASAPVCVMWADYVGLNLVSAAAGGRAEDVAQLLQKEANLEERNRVSFVFSLLPLESCMYQCM